MKTSIIKSAVAKFFLFVFPNGKFNQIDNVAFAANRIAALRWLLFAVCVKGAVIFSLFFLKGRKRKI